MSTYYEFYLGKKTPEGKIAMVAPFKYNLQSGEFERKPIICRSNSFIDWDVFSEFMQKLEIDKMVDSDVNFFAFEDVWNAEPNIKHSVSYYCPYVVMVNASAKAGLRQGYVELPYFNSIIKNGYEAVDEYDYDMISAEQYVEMPADEQARFGKIAFLVRDSADRIAKTLVDSTAEIVGYDCGDYVFICRVL